MLEEVLLGAPWREASASVFVGFLVLRLGSHHCYYFCPDWVPISDGHSCQDRKVSWLLWGQEICTLSTNVSHVLSTRRSLHLLDLSTLMCTSGPWVLGVYPEFRLLPLWRCSSQRAPKVPLMFLLPSRGLPQTQFVLVFFAWPLLDSS